MMTFTGKMIFHFGIIEQPKWAVNTDMIFESKDYCGFRKSPIGNSFSPRFVVFLCYVL